MTNIGENIRRLRKQKKMTLDKLATLTGLSKSYLSMLERNETMNPTVSSLEKIISALGINRDELMNGDEWTYIANQIRETGVDICTFRELADYLKWKQNNRK